MGILDFGLGWLHFNGVIVSDAEISAHDIATRETSGSTLVVEIAAYDGRSIHLDQEALGPISHVALNLVDLRTIFRYSRSFTLTSNSHPKRTN